ncbi:hypothetical protein FQR65_LT14437 [Abscondita terminalis]|nr:hypothetical protein FQR65_LT14437 [Abscondita terminalis]
MSHNLRNRYTIRPPIKYSPSAATNAASYLQNSKQNMEGTITLTNEQFQTLIANVAASNRSATPPTTTVHPNSGNFSKCSSRFSGHKADDCDAFIDAISVYKECLNISDDNAIKGLSMLLDGQAATWWHGIKNNTATWEDALKSLRHAFGCNKPPHQIFRELFTKEQGDREPTDVFISNARSLLSRLPARPELHETHKLNMVYGLLSRKIRERLPRDQVSDFSELIDKARAIEDNFVDKQDIVCSSRKNVLPTGAKPLKLRPKCDYCHNFGHVQTDCRKYAASLARSQALTENTSATVTNKLVCFGCGKPGYVKSQCPQCQPKTSFVRSPPSTSSMSSVDVLSATVNADAKRPMFKIRIYDLVGLACVDTGAKCSIAGHKLYTYLDDNHFPFTSDTVEMTLADGYPREVDVKNFQCEVNLEGRTIKVTFMAIPDHMESKTLLGIDFLTEASVVLNIPKMQWWFEDEPHTKHTFHHVPNIATNTTTDTASVDINVSLRENEAATLNAVEKEQLESLLNDQKVVFEAIQEPTTYAEHSIRLTDDTPIYVPPYRLINSVTVLLPQESGQRIRDEQLNDPDVKKIIDTFESEDPNAIDYTRWTDRGYVMSSGVLYRYTPDVDADSPTGEKWVFAIEDTATRWMELFALTSATAEACAKCLIDEKSPTSYQVAHVHEPDVPLGTYHVSALKPYPTETTEVPIHPIRKRGRPKKSTVISADHDSHVPVRNEIPVSSLPASSDAEVIPTSSLPKTPDDSMPPRRSHRLQKISPSRRLPRRYQTNIDFIGFLPGRISKTKGGECNVSKLNAGKKRKRDNSEKKKDRDSV